MQQEERDFRFPVYSGDFRAPVCRGGGGGENGGAERPRYRGRAKRELVLQRPGTVRVSIALQRCGKHSICSC